MSILNAKNLFLFLLFIIFYGLEKSEAAKVIISGKAADYANQVIEIKSLHDFISEEHISLGWIKINPQGQFTTEIELNEITHCFADFDGYHGMIYLEPGRNYEILLPPKRKLTEAQKRNPFEKPDPVWFGLANPDKNELNYLIQQFEQAYLNYENKYFDQIFINRSRSLVDSVKLILSKEYPKSNVPFFEAHKQFRKASLEFALHQGKSASFLEDYFSKTPPNYNLNSYATLFNQMFSNYFNVLINGNSGAEIKKTISLSDLQKLDGYFQEKLHFNSSLSHWVILKSLKDAYYNKQFEKAAILKMLDQITQAGWSSYEIKTARIIRNKLTYLSSGTIPPQLSLKNSSGQKINLTDHKNNYIYLHFTDPKNSICRQHLDALKTVASHYQGKLIIINIIPDISSFKNENNWPGIFAETTNDLATTYKIKTFPNSFLIGKDGKLLLSPAPNPIDGLDRQLGQIFKSDYFKEIQKPVNNPTK